MWVKETRSGWDKRQASLLLCIFADGIDRIAPVIIFHGTGPRLGQEKPKYDPRITVRFNSTAYSNESLFSSYISDYVVPAHGGRHSLFAMDVAQFHKTPTIPEQLKSHKITPSFIHSGCTGLVQPLDISVNPRFKDILRDTTEQEILHQEQNGLDKWSVGDRRIATTWCVGRAWAEFTGRDLGEKIIQDSFPNVGLALPIDPSQDSQLRVKGFRDEELVIGDWRRDIAVENGDLQDIIHEAEDENTLVDYNDSNE